MLSLAPLHSGGWQANLRLRRSDGWLIADGETIVAALANVLPKPLRKDNGARAAQEPADDGLFD